MADLISLENRIKKLETENRLLKEQILSLKPSFGNTGTIDNNIDCNGYNANLRQFFRHGNLAQSDYQVDKICMDLGDDKAFAIDKKNKTGSIGMAIGYSGFAISFVDSIPPDEIVEV